MDNCFFQLLYEKQMTEIRFASFFLAKILNRDGISGSVDLNHLASLDPVLYRYILLRIKSLRHHIQFHAWLRQLS